MANRMAVGGALLDLGLAGTLICCALGAIPSLNCTVLQVSTLLCGGIGIIGFCMRRVRGTQG